MEEHRSYDWTESRHFDFRDVDLDSGVLVLETGEVLGGLGNPSTISASLEFHLAEQERPKTEMQYWPQVGDDTSWIGPFITFDILHPSPVLTNSSQTLDMAWCPEAFQSRLRKTRSSGLSRIPMSAGQKGYGGMKSLMIEDVLPFLSTDMLLATSSRMDLPTGAPETFAKLAINSCVASSLWSYVRLPFKLHASSISLYPCWMRSSCVEVITVTERQYLSFLIWVFAIRGPRTAHFGATTTKPMAE